MRNRSGRYRFLNVLAAAVAALLVLSFVPPATGEEQPLVTVDRLAMEIPDDALGDRTDPVLFVNSQARRAFNVLRTSDGTRIRIVDLDRLEIVASVTVPYQIRRSAGTPADTVEWVHAVDEERNMLYLAYTALGGTAGGVLEVDGDALEAGKEPSEVVRAMSITEATEPTSFVEVRPDPDEPATVCTAERCLPQVPHTPNANAYGMAFVPAQFVGRPKILILRQEPTTPGEQHLWVAQWDVETGRQDWIHRVASCGAGRLPPGNYQIALFQARLGPYIYLGCNGPGGLGFAVRLLVDENNRPQSEEAFAGPQHLRDVFADPEGDRLLFRVSSTEGEAWWVFNGSREAFSGVLSGTVTPRNTGAGLDPLSGRLYMLAPPTKRGRSERRGGLLVSDIRNDPAPQFLEFDQFAPYAGGPDMTGIPVDVNPASGQRQVFVLPQGDEETDCSPGGRCEYLVVRDDLPVATVPPLEDLDRFTVDEDEQPGVTGVNFTGSGHAYGLRTLFVGGLDGVAPGEGGRGAAIQAGSPCGRQDREYVFGQVARAALSNDLAAGAAAAADTDAGSKIDIEEPVERCWPFPPALWFLEDEWPRPSTATGEEDNPIDEAAGHSWPFQTAECAGEGEAAHDHARLGEHELSGFTAAVACRQEQEEVTGQGRASPVAGALEDAGVEDPGIVRVGDVGGDVRVYRDPERGLVARSEAFARNISIDDEIFIDSAMTVAESWAAGRSGSASTFFARRLCNVRYPNEEMEEAVLQEVRGQVPPEVGVPPTGEADSCGDPSIPVVSGTIEPNLSRHPFMAALDRALGTRGEVNVPEPDFELAQGTSGGYLASIQRDRLEELSNRVVNNDPATQVPALEIVIFNDHPTHGRGRQVYQFAGTDASATYGIFLREGFETADDLLDFDLPALITEMTVPPSMRARVLQEAQQAQGEDPNGAAVGAQRNPIKMMFEGLGFLLRSPRDAFMAALMWLLLFTPVYLALRRRALKEAMA